MSTWVHEYMSTWVHPDGSTIRKEQPNLQKPNLENLALKFQLTHESKSRVALQLPQIPLSDMFNSLIGYPVVKQGTNLMKNAL